jgi:hypothetical protein
MNWTFGFVIWRKERKMHIHHLARQYVLADYNSGGGGGSVVIGILVIGVLIAAAIGYNRFKMNGFRPRTVTTRLTGDQLRAIFRDTVAGTSWSIVDEGNPIVAQSSLLMGIRQQIALQVTEANGTTHARIMVLRYSKKILGGTTKAYTLRWRMTSFLNEVMRTDRSASVVG